MNSFLQVSPLRWCASVAVVDERLRGQKDSIWAIIRSRPRESEETSISRLCSVCSLDRSMYKEEFRDNSSIRASSLMIAQPSRSIIETTLMRKTIRECVLKLMIREDFGIIWHHIRVRRCWRWRNEMESAQSWWAFYSGKYVQKLNYIYENLLFCPFSSHVNARWSQVRSVRVPCKFFT